MFLSFNAFCRSLLFLAVFYSCLYVDLFVALFSMKSLFFLCSISFMILYNRLLTSFNLYFSPDYKDSMFLYICLNMFLCFYPISSSFIFWFFISSFRMFPFFISFVIRLRFSMFFFCMPIFLLVFLFIYLTCYLNA